MAGLSITHPRITVTVERVGDQSESVGEVSIFNLSPEHAQSIYERGDAIVVQAGYPSTVATIFAGIVQRPTKGRSGLAHITHLRLGDTVRAPARLGGVTMRSYDGVARIRDIAIDFVRDIFRVPTQQELDELQAAGRVSISLSIDDFLRALNPVNIIDAFRGGGSDAFSFNFHLGPLDAIPSDATVSNYSYSGPSTNGLTALLKTVDCGWYEDDGAIRFRRVGRPQVDGVTITVTPETGLVGVPRETDDGAEALMFLNPQVHKGDTLDLRSDALTGTYHIVALRHNADNWSGPFTTWVDLRPME